ncbi:hypothetical protein DL96DRAFT_1631525, partial [Flagelloscypha sp. PMI_526]
MLSKLVSTLAGTFGFLMALLLRITAMVSVPEIRNFQARRRFLRLQMVNQELPKLLRFLYPLLKTIKRGLSDFFLPIVTHAFIPSHIISNFLSSPLLPTTYKLSWLLMSCLVLCFKSTFI